LRNRRTFSASNRLIRRTARRRRNAKALSPRRTSWHPRLEEKEVIP
jgi:hypothetical protein